MRALSGSGTLSLRNPHKHHAQAWKTASSIFTDYFLWPKFFQQFCITNHDSFGTCFRPRRRTELFNSFFPLSPTISECVWWNPHPSCSAFQVRAAALISAADEADDEARAHVARVAALAAAAGAGPLMTTSAMTAAADKLNQQQGRASAAGLKSGADGRQSGAGGGAYGSGGGGEDASRPLTARLASDTDRIWRAADEREVSAMFGGGGGSGSQTARTHSRAGGGNNSIKNSSSGKMLQSRVAAAGAIPRSPSAADSTAFRSSASVSGNSYGQGMNGGTASSRPPPVHPASARVAFRGSDGTHNSGGGSGGGRVSASFPFSALGSGEAVPLEAYVDGRSSSSSFASSPSSSSAAIGAASMRAGGSRYGRGSLMLSRDRLHASRVGVGGAMDGAGEPDSFSELMVGGGTSNGNGSGQSGARAASGASSPFRAQSNQHLPSPRPASQQQPQPSMASSSLSVAANARAPAGAPASAASLQLKEAMRAGRWESKPPGV